MELEKTLEHVLQDCKITEELKKKNNYDSQQFQWREPFCNIAFLETEAKFIPEVTTAESGEKKPHEEMLPLLDFTSSGKDLQNCLCREESTRVLTKLQHNLQSTTKKSMVILI